MSLLMAVFGGGNRSAEGGVGRRGDRGLRGGGAGGCELVSKRVGRRV